MPNSMYIFDKKTMASAEAMSAEYGVELFDLMSKAGESIADCILNITTVQNKRIVLLCSAGNNGGDGFIVADRLYCEGAEVTVVLTHKKPSSDIAERAFSLMKEGITVTEDTDCLNSADIIVDAIFGTGLTRNIEGATAELIDRVNKSGATVFSVDIPSGVEADTGRVLGCAVKADYTLALGAFKPCHILPEGRRQCGELLCLDIGIPKRLLEKQNSPLKAIEKPELKKRDAVSHKGSYGTALAVVGSYGMVGAAILSGKAALRSGVGLLKMAACPENYTAIALALPEAVQTANPTEALGKATALLVGCGMGVSHENKKLIEELVLSSNVPVIIDADGINNIAGSIEFIKQANAPIIFTPHPAEMARLVGKTAAEVESDRIGIAKAFAAELGVTVCLKGTNTLVATPDGQVFVNLIGNAGMASAGSGDMLAGVMLALLAKGEEVTSAVCSAVWLHSAAGDAACRELGEESMLPSDMIERLHLFL